MSSLHSAKPKVGVRNTRQRAAVVEVLDELSNFSSAKEIHHQLEERNSHVGLTTVYRTLQSLADMDAVDVLHMASGETLYRACDSRAHHHHLVCTKCGKTKEINGGPVESWARKVAKDNGFEMVGHEAEVFGICPDCQKLAEDSAE